MKTITIIASALGILFSFSFNKTNLLKSNTINYSVQKQTPKAEKYRLIVSFTSKGTGINSEQRQAFIDYVDNHPKKPVYKAVLWGREGEKDYCFKLTELSKKEQASFIAEVKKILSGSDLAKVEENKACEHHGRLQTKS